MNEAIQFLRAVLTAVTAVIFYVIAFLTLACSVLVVADSFNRNHVTGG
jgi:hypothetical protein